MPNSRYKRTVKVALKRSGDEATVLRASSGTENNYGKTDGEWTNPTTVGTWYGLRSYKYNSDRPEQEFIAGGERDTQTPVFLLPAEADVTDGDRIEYKNSQYEVTADPVEYDTHYECRTIKVE